MKIVVLADIHGKINALERLQTPLSEADVVLLAGDITNFGHAEQAAEIVETIRRYARRVLAVGGNCDPPPVEAWLSQAGVNLNGRAVKLDSWWFIGVAGALPSFGGLPNESGELLF